MTGLFPPNGKPVDSTRINLRKYTAVNFTLRETYSPDFQPSPSPPIYSKEADENNKQKHKPDED